MKKIALILIGFLFVLPACEKDDDMLNFVVDTGITIYLNDDFGNDLLSPENENAIDESKIQVLRLIDGEWKEPYVAHLDYPKHYRFIHEAGYNVLVVWPDFSLEQGEFPETLIKWNENDIDTIKCKAEETRVSLIVKKVWLNDNVVWDDYGIEREIVLEK